MSANATNIDTGNFDVAESIVVLGNNNRISISDTETETDLRHCRDALFITDPREDRTELTKFKGDRVEGTCEWIRDDDTYQAWLQSDASQLLWISGGPGRGKTMLSIFLTRELESFVDGQPVQLLFYFCNRKSEKHNTETALLRTWLHEMFDKNPELARHAIGRMGNKKRAQQTLESRSTLWAIFEKVLDDPKLGPVLSVLDGLDEWVDESKQWLVRSFQTFFGKPSSGQRKSIPNAFKLAIISRDILGLHGYRRLDLEAKSDAIASDVKQVVNARVKEHPRYKAIDPKFWAKITVTLEERSNGTFLWAGVVIDQLLSKQTTLQMNTVLNTVPDGLEAVYSHILLQIAHHWRKEIARLLRWVTLLKEPVTVPELGDALCINMEDPEDRVLMISELVVLSGIVAEDRASRSISLACPRVGGRFPRKRGH